MRTTYFPALALACILALTACASDKLKAQPTTLPATTVELPTTTAPAPTTTTVAATTTIPATAVPVPATTQSDVAPVVAAVAEFLTSRGLCLESPSTCDASTYVRGSQLTAESAFIRTAIERRATMRDDANDPTYFAPSVVNQDDAGMTASVRGCLWDTAGIFGEGGVVINNVKVSKQTTVSLAFEEGRWWVTGIQFTGRIENENVCPPRG
jgi:hypothetical protein